MGANVKYKDSVFSFLFSDPDILRELYGAIAGLELPSDIPVTINTLEGVLYKTLLNDISFEIAKQLVILLEHQSAINPNLPVRLLLYIARVYEKIISGRNIYGSKKFFIRAEGFNTPPFRAVKKVLNPECNTSGEQHTSPFRARLLI
ncbi:MAG: hypothetical protein LBG14_04595, partial [Treponema sp.]|nr:hypothetical protein [Treponema sp.]